VIGLAGAASAAGAQQPEYARFVEEANRAAPPPSAAEISPIALETLQTRHRELGRCVPTGLSLGEPRPITATRHISEMIRRGEVRNAWTVYARLEGCEERRPLHLVVVRPADGPLLVAPLVYGEAIANPTVVLDVRDPAGMAAAAMARQLVPGCAAVTLEGFRSVSQSADLSPDFYGVRYRGSWREAWSFTACGRRIELPITFTADGQSGTSYSIHASEARLID
jgi:hypothetical protein